MNSNIKTLDIIKNIFITKIYLGMLLVSILAFFTLFIVYFKIIVPSFYEQMMNNVEDEAKRIGSHIKWHQSDNIDIFLLSKLKDDFGLYKVRIFDKSGKIVLSTKVDEIGQMSTYEYFKTELPKGHIYTKIDKKEILNENNQKTVIDVAEIYVPIMFSSTIFGGASEIYFDISKQKNDFESLLDKIAQILTFGVSFYFIFLSLVLYYSSKNSLKEKSQELMMFEQSKLASLGEMIGNIAHQWRQPLSIITSSATTLKVEEQLGVMSSKDFTNTMDKIVSSSQYLSETIDDFRNFFDTTKEKKLVNLKNVVTSTISIIEDTLKNNQINLDLELMDSEIEIFENELKQVLINLINNSKDILIDKKNSNLENKIIFIKIKKNGSKNIITIKDNAGGVPLEIINKIFEPYFTTKHKSIGTGIGLYMCKTIIEKNMQGEISVQNCEYTYKNNNYKGALFTIEI